jgi:hypothetical protein
VALVGGTARFTTTTPFPAGSYTVTVAYPGDNNYQGSQGSISGNIAKA